MVVMVVVVVVVVEVMWRRRLKVHIKGSVGGPAYHTLPYRKGVAKTAYL